MQEVLQTREADESQIDEGLSALARVVDSDRQNLLRELEEEIANCEETEKDIIGALIVSTSFGGALRKL